MKAKCRIPNMVSKPIGIVVMYKNKKIGEVQSIEYIEDGGYSIANITIKCNDIIEKLTKGSNQHLAISMSNTEEKKVLTK